jgi:hypothetical protein
MKHPIAIVLVLVYIVGFIVFSIGCTLEEAPLVQDPPLTQEDSSQIFPEVAIGPKNSFFLMHTQFTTQAVATLYFRPLTSLLADSYTIECSTDGNTFEDFLQQGQTVTITEETAIGIDVRLVESLHFRLKIQGGPFDGDHTNTMYAPYAEQGGYLQRWSIITAMHLTGVSAPQAGHGIEVEMEIRDYVSATDFSLNPILSDAIGSWTWYRVNPLDFDEKAPITDANSDFYTTTNDDRGKLIMVEANGNGSSFYGLVRIITTVPVQ